MGKKHDKVESDSDSDDAPVAISKTVAKTAFLKQQAAETTQVKKQKKQRVRKEKPAAESDLFKTELPTETIQQKKKE